MLTFAVFTDQSPAADWPLRHARMLGPDETVLGTEVTFEEGLIRCDKRTTGSAALTLQWDAGDAGRLMLDTCLLPDRDHPYLLSLELARKRIMLCLTKLEEWMLFDAPADDPAMVSLRTAHDQFMRALAKGPGPEGDFTPEQDQMARTALEKAIEASELLTDLDAERRLARRVSGATQSGLRHPPPLLGCAVRTDRSTPGLQSVVAESFDFLSIPVPWATLEPEEGVSYRFHPFDQWIEWAVRRARLPVALGPLIDFRPKCVPEWLYIWENDYETLRELVYEHVKKVVTRYRRAVSHWTVVSGLHVNSDFTLSLEQIVDLTRLCALVVRKLHKNARIQVEITRPFGEYAAYNQHAIPPLLYAELLFQAGVAVDSIGLRLEMGDSSPGHETRDMMQIARLLDEFCAFDKPISLSAVGVPSAPSPSHTFGEDGAYDPGFWRKQWSEKIQADWLTQLARTALARPQITSVVWSELYDGADACGLLNGGLITDAGQPKSALKRVAELRSRLRSGEMVKRTGDV